MRVGNEVMCGVKTLGSRDCLVKVTMDDIIKAFNLLLLSESDKIFSDVFSPFCVKCL